MATGTKIDPKNRHALDASRLSALFDSRVLIGIAPVRDGLSDLPEEEQALVKGAVGIRQREFSSGRRLAHRLLQDLGFSAVTILRDEDRVPLWPAGIVGSISHSRTLAVVALTRSTTVRGLGVDIEPDIEVRDGVERVVCTEAERAWLDETAVPDSIQPSRSRGRQVKLIFSAKESVYKAFYPRTRVYWNFHDVELQIDEESERFEATLPPSAGRPRIEGRFLREEGSIVTAVIVD